MNKPTWKWVTAITLASSALLLSCADEKPRGHNEDTDEVEGSDGGGDGTVATDDGGGARADGGVDGGTGKPSGLDGGGDKPAAQNDAGTSTSSGNGNSNSMTTQSDGGGTAQGEGGSAAQSECATRAKDECDYQKMCDAVGFAREWDGDSNQFCIPKRQAACEKGFQISSARAISAACSTWVHQSCDNYRNFTYRVYDSNTKWQYGDPACEVAPTFPRGSKASGNDCTSDYECQAGLFCKVTRDDWDKQDRSDVEAVCGKCTAQFTYDGPIEANPVSEDEGVCNRQEMCKAGYQCLSVYGNANGEFRSFSFVNATRKDLKHCVKAISKAPMDMPCAPNSNAQCQDGLICQLDPGSITIGKCKVASSATIPTYVGKDARCDPALCDKRLNLECKPVQVNGMTESRCVQQAIAPIGGFCKNDKKETVAECSQFARCNENSGQCTRRNVETESCFASVTTPGVNDRGSCDANVFDEQALVCRQDGGELATHCHKALPQNLCTLH